METRLTKVTRLNKSINFSIVKITARKLINLIRCARDHQNSQRSFSIAG